MSKKLIEENGRINPKATARDLETICTDPTYKTYIPWVTQHPACWPELERWVHRYVADPHSAGAPPMPPEEVSNSKHLGMLARLDTISFHPRIPGINFTALGTHKKMVFLILGALTLLLAVISLPRTQPVSADTTPTASAATASGQTTDAFSAARKVADEAKQSPVYDSQLKASVQKLEKDISAKDSKQVQTDMKTVKDLQQQKENVKIGEVTEELTDSIEKVGKYNDVQDIPEHKEMVTIADRWSGKDIEPDNLSKAAADSTKLQQLIRRCAQVQKERKEKQQAQQKKQEEQQARQQAQEEADPGQTQQNESAVPATPTQQPTVQPSPQSTPRKQTAQPQSQPKSNQSSGNGTDGVAIG